MSSSGTTLEAAVTEPVAVTTASVGTITGEGNAVSEELEEEGEELNYQEWSGVDTMESMCMRCHANGVTRIMLHKIPYFRELVIASFACEECGERNNEVTFGGEIQIQGCVYELEVRTQRDLDRQLIKSDSATVRIKELDFEIPPMTQKGEISTIEGFLRTAAKNLGLFQAQRMEEQPEVGTRVAQVISGLSQMAFGAAFPFHVLVDDPAGNSFVENPNAPTADPYLTTRRYFRSADQDRALGLQPDKGVYKDDKESNFKALMFGEGFGAVKKGETASEPAGAELKREAEMALTESTSAMTNSGPGASEKSSSFLFNGHGEVISIPSPCPNCNHTGESLTAVTSIPHFKEVIIMAFDCQLCGYRTNEVKPGGAVPTLGTQVTLTVADTSDLKRDILKSDSAGILVPELDLELSNGTLGGVFTTVEGLLNKIHASLKEGNPFASGDSTQLHHSQDQKLDESHVRFNEFLAKLKQFANGERSCFPFRVVLRDPLGNSFISAPLGSFLPPEADPALVIEDFKRTFDEDEEFGLHDINTRDYETGVDYEESEVIVSDLKQAGGAKRGGADHPTPFAMGTVENDSTQGGFYCSTAAAAGSGGTTTAAATTTADDDEPAYYNKVEGYSAERMDGSSSSSSKADATPDPSAYESAHCHRHLDPADKNLKFIPYEEFSGRKTGYVFRMGFQGIGYYEDKHVLQSSAAQRDETSAGEN